VIREDTGMSTAESVIVGGKDFTATDAEARAVMAHLADQGVTEATIARTPYRVLVNVILQARLELQDARSYLGSR
jgi:hypothetical protein